LIPDPAYAHASAEFDGTLRNIQVLEGKRREDSIQRQRNKHATINNYKKNDEFYRRISINLLISMEEVLFGFSSPFHDQEGSK
jgi:hypothetical protein